MHQLVFTIPVPPFQVKSQECLKLANGVVDGLSPEIIPRVRRCSQPLFVRARLTDPERSSFRGLEALFPRYSCEILVHRDEHVAVGNPFVVSASLTQQTKCPIDKSSNRMYVQLLATNTAEAKRAPQGCTSLVARVILCPRSHKAEMVYGKCSPHLAPSERSGTVRLTRRYVTAKLPAYSP